jgi:hypothetical protein
MGEMGASVGRVLVESGVRVVISLAGRSQASAGRAAKAGVEVVDDDGVLVSQADFVLSIVPPSRVLRTIRVSAADGVKFSGRQQTGRHPKHDHQNRSVHQSRLNCSGRCRSAVQTVQDPISYSKEAASAWPAEFRCLYNCKVDLIADSSAFREPGRMAAYGNSMKHRFVVDMAAHMQ